MSTIADGRDERRRSERHPVDDLSGSLLFSHRCRVLDLSARGLAVRTGTPLAPGRGYRLRLEHGGRRVDLTGTVAWCRLQGTERDEEGELRPVYRAGLELEGELGGELSTLQELIGSRELVDVERRVSARLRLPQGSAESREGSDRTELLVRSSSRTGMTFVAPIEPAVGDRLRLEVDLDEEPLVLDVEVTGVGAAEEGRSEITVGFHALADDARRRLDELIREEMAPERE